MDGDDCLEARYRVVAVEDLFVGGAGDDTIDGGRGNEAVNVGKDLEFKDAHANQPDGQHQHGHSRAQGNVSPVERLAKKRRVNPGHEPFQPPAGEPVKVIAKWPETKVPVTATLMRDGAPLATAPCTRNAEGNPGFTKDPGELNYVLDSAYNDTMTDYLGTLDAIYGDVQRDILNIDNEENLIRSKYIVIFLSDGMSNVQGGRQSDSEIWNRVEETYDMATEAGATSGLFHLNQKK